MNLIAEAPALLVGLLALLLIAGGVEDAVRLRISNMISLAILLLAVVAALVVGVELVFWKNVAVFAGLLAFGTLLFATGNFGGGDVKLLAATGLWVGFLASLTLLAAVFITGGILALVILGSRMVVPVTWKDRVAVLRPGSGIPYGIAIAIGALITIVLQRMM